MIHTSSFGHKKLPRSILKVFKFNDASIYRFYYIMRVCTCQKKFMINFKQ